MNDIEKMSLEEAMTELEKTVASLEENKTTLDQSIEIFEKGIKLVARSRKLLDEYSAKITVLKKENGLFVEESFESENYD
ncbi:MAG: exodeoxyribonuclease VII small subunit [Clostridia bacterium]|nr:exodeoxyribonuclease VII small subunit [Clostridia bacterium]